jgi:hypothetical protein
LTILGYSAPYLAISHYPFSSFGSRPKWRDFNPRRVSERSFNLQLLVKPYMRISRIRLSSGISHSRKLIYRTDTPARFGLQQLFDNLHDLCQMAFSPTIFSGLPFWYVAIRLLLSCCQPFLYPDQNPFAGSGFSLHIVAPYIHRCRFYVSSACPSSLLWVHPTPVNALVWLSHTGYTSPTFIHSIESGNPEPCRVLIQFHGRR